MKNIKRTAFLLLCIFTIVISVKPNTNTAEEVSDSRGWIHGVNWITIDTEDVLIFSSNGYRPTKPTGEWNHNIYYSWFNTDNITNTFKPKVLVDAKLAQEPSSAAINSNGYIIITSEDSEFHPESLDQTFGIFDSGLKKVITYGKKLMPPQGGHSGHVAASGDKFLVTFCDGWIDGGGAYNLGTGDDIYSRIVNQDGTMGSLIKTQVSEKSRDWWPIVSGSDTEWLQVWQQYNETSSGGTLLGAITSKSGKIVKKFPITKNNKYYYYDVGYIDSLGVYMVTGSRMDGGFVSLINKKGTIVAEKTKLPYTVREAKTLINEFGQYATAVYPTYNTGAAVLKITKNSITLKKTVKVEVTWDYMGTDGTFVSDTKVIFATGTKNGIKFVPIKIN
ncbi:hypothetical protein [Anaeromicropila herbilytica]|uniref:Uncharacterized protein n=1 Tax=Anaeromicropila herbilytica TaxID=2785025 RepID=A0A7R7EJ69_9FIRM|nr:hypothetical protein [Anaeromicropila herbilytica]BCN29739.1 hypothetical protein bsdtb5_10340 [Anaeromicropila herbilytica]